MSTIVNARDVLLQAASPRVLPVTIDIGDVDGLDGVLNTLKSVKITASANMFTGSTPSPTTITLTCVKTGLSGSVTWSVIAGSAGAITPSGDNCTVTGTSVAGNSITVRARVTENSINYDAQFTVIKLGGLSVQSTVSLASQVTGQLAAGNVTGLGALALLNVVDLNTQTVGALNGATQVTNLGTLAYANAIAANQIGAGTLAAGVIYAGSINADNVTSGTFTGRRFRTATSGNRIEILVDGADAHQLLVYNSAGSAFVRLTDAWSYFSGTGGFAALTAVGGSSNSGGLSAQGHGTGTGVESFSPDGTGVWGRSTNGAAGHFDSTNALCLVLTGSGMFRVQTRATLPGTAVDGTMLFHSTHGLVQRIGGQWKAPTLSVVS